MTTTLTPADLIQLVSQLSSRVDQLERRLRAVEEVYEPELPFVQSGAVSTGQSPPWVRRKAGTLQEMVLLLGQAGTSATVVTLTKNGNVIATGTLSAGVDQVHITIGVPASPDTDRFVAAVTSAGAGAEDLTVATRWSQ